MKRAILIGLGVVGAAALLLLVLREAEPPAAPAGHKLSSLQPTTGATGAGNVTRPALPSDDKPAAESDSPEYPYREYVRDDGTLVRDHRTGIKAPDFTPQTLRAPGVRKVPPEVIVAVRNAMRPIVRKCADNLNTQEFGEQPRLQSQVTISIFEGRLSIDDVFLYVADVADSDVDMITTCIKTPMEQLLLPAAGQEELSEYVLTLPFRLRR